MCQRLKGWDQQYDRHQKKQETKEESVTETDSLNADRPQRP